MSIGKFGDLTLYHHPATRSARIKWLLHELIGGAFEEKRIALYDGEQYRPDFLALNPSHSVPVITVRTMGRDTITLAESGAITVYLADLFPECGLAPPPTPLSAERARYLYAIHYCGAQIDLALWQIRIHTHILPAADRDAATHSRYRRKFQQDVEPTLRGMLDAGDYIVGPSFSAADCMIGHAVLWARSYGLCSAPPFRAYLSRVSKRPAFVAAFADAREFDPEVPESAAIHARFNG